MQESGRPCSDLNAGAFFSLAKEEASSIQKMAAPAAPAASRLPPRLVSDQMINIYFQEWAPLFPVVHRPTVLKDYTEYVSNPEGFKDKHAVAQLNLIFGIAALSAEVSRLINISICQFVSHLYRAQNKVLSLLIFNGNRRLTLSSLRTLCPLYSVSY